MENIISHLEIAKHEISAGLTALGVINSQGGSAGANYSDLPQSGSSDIKPPTEYTTYARGEEEGTPIIPPHEISTLAIGEEDSISESPVEATTLMRGEEDGNTRPFDTVTTLMIGEEESQNSPPFEISTASIGEEEASHKIRTPDIISGSPDNDYTIDESDAYQNNNLR